jgi:hypothetical protein
MLGFELDIWDYLTFATLFLTVVAVLSVYVWIAGLPGRIALARNHPEAEAVMLLGWAGLLPTVYPWVQALIWAFKPTDKVDIRRFPEAEAIANAAEIARLRGKATPAAAPAPDPGATAASASSAGTGGYASAGSSTELGEGR